MPLNLKRSNPYLRYLAPFTTFLLLSLLQENAWNLVSYWAFYSMKIALTAAVLAYLFSGRWQEIEGMFDIRAVLVGLGVLVVWIIGCQRLAPMPTFEPMELPSAIAVMLVLIVKLFGAIAIVPLMEEITFRSFLMRYLINEKFLSVPLGRYTFFSFWTNVLVFALMHPAWQWGVALFAGAVYSLYLVRTKNLLGCIIAHGVTNFGLALFVLITRQWVLW